MAQAGVLAAAATAAAGGSTNAVSSLLLQSFAQALRQGQGACSAASNNEGVSNGDRRASSNSMGQRQHALATAPSAMEDISRLGDSSSATSTSDGSSAVRIPCRARGMPLDHTIEVRRKGIFELLDASSSCSLVRFPSLDCILFCFQ
jgi:hypothetical protein